MIHFVDTLSLSFRLLSIHTARTIFPLSRICFRSGLFILHHVPLKRVSLVVTVKEQRLGPILLLISLLINNDTDPNLK